MVHTTQGTTEGYLPTPHGWVWYQTCGLQLPTIPLLVLHGGPGAGHRYLAPLTALAVERRVIFYDQLGCGLSENVNNPTLWQMEHFVKEITLIRQWLGLEQIHLFGHSWGGWLAIEYLLTQPTGVVSLTLASTSAGLPEYQREV